MTKVIIPIEASATATVKEFTPEEAAAILPTIKAEASKMTTDYEAATVAIDKMRNDKYKGDGLEAWKDKAYRDLAMQRRMGVAGWASKMTIAGIKVIAFDPPEVVLDCTDAKKRRWKEGQNDYIVEAVAIGV